MNRVPEGVPTAISAAYEKRVRAMCAGAFPDALRLRERLDPQRWVLEWHLADWVGEALGVESSIRNDITLSNALILASVVWQDDLEDGELRVADVVAARRIGHDLFAAAMEPYRALIPANSPFWQAVDRWMGVWRDATINAALAEVQSNTSLANRGAPLKIPAYGLCLLGDRADVFPELEASIEHALTGLVLYDHFVDWSKDLADGRWNAFVSFALGGRQRPAPPSSVSVQASMLAGPVVERYFELIDTELTTAQRSAATAGVPEMAHHLRDLAHELHEEGRSLASRYDSLGEQTTQLIFGEAKVKQAVTA